MKVAIVSAFVDPFNKDNSRVYSIIDMFERNGIEPVLFTTNFDHRKKKFYKLDAKTVITTHFVQVKKYKRNLSLNRFISHIIFALRLRKLIKENIDKFDLIYCTTPTTLAPFFLLKLCKQRKSRLILDVIDIWPESFFIFFERYHNLVKFLLYPWYYISKFNYKHSDIVIAGSKDYANYTEKLRSNKVNPYYLGIDLSKIKSLVLHSSLVITKESNEVWICYAGSLGKSYDFDVIINSFKRIQLIFSSVKLFFIGGGEEEHRIKEIIIKDKINGYVTGVLEYSDYLKWLSYCDIAINSFKENTKVAHSYKFNDYIGVGCCVLNNLKGETWDFIEEYDIGLNFDYDKNPLYDKLFYLLTNFNMIDVYKKNCISIATTHLNKKNIYDKLFSEEIVKLL